MKCYKPKSHYFSHVDTRFLLEFLPTTMFRLAGIFLVSVYTSMLKIFMFISKYLCGSKNEKNGSNISAKHSQKDNEVVSEMSNAVELQRHKDSCENIAKTEDSVFLQSRWISNTSNSEFVSEKSVSGHIEEPRNVKIMVQEIFLGSEENLVNRNLDREIHPRDSLDKNLEISVEGIEFSNEVDSWKSANLEANDQTKHEDIKEDGNIDQTCVAIQDSMLENLNVVYIQLEAFSVNPTDISKKETITDSWNSASDEENESDVLWEHHNLVQQLKMELKNCRIRVLPTISEEFETSKMLEDLKPLKIDQKFEYKDVMKEIQKFYKIYAEKMHKLDVLNYQTLNAISFLQMKDSKVLSRCKKISASPHLYLSKIWPSKARKIYADTMEKPITDMHRVLELVYLGQLCLSWEILFWLYVKAQEIMEYDSKQHRLYNRAAEEFQKFHVLLQRFMEDEQFQGPRILNYVKNRCMVRVLLEVPMIKGKISELETKRRKSERKIDKLLS
ncbi:hypothetical protein CDL12_10182 [Handroanthus impetiginosus]|uniref:Ribosomal protein L34Ae n=1 Tax=Handroanthus impetiginosus TaxID=429701 RepID=A0A2G9HIP4_9LAMI|nr:hypothetical protein CDL12_10182 [Handroanthus impetiginosus]